MFKIFNKKQIKGKMIKLKINGMHCVSCCLNIDGTLEETQGVIESKTKYASSLSEVTFDPLKIDQNKITAIIKKLGYNVSLI